jgi:hypothetical protein
MFTCLHHYMYPGTCLHVHVYMYMFTCTCICLHVHIYIYIFTCTFTYMCIQDAGKPAVSDAKV